MSKTQLTDGSPVPEDRSHTEINPATGQQRGYVVLTPEERAKGFVKPVRRSYTHKSCRTLTTMSRDIAETYARDPYFYSGTFCVGCGKHFPLDQFDWEDGEPMDTLQQPEWAEKQLALQEKRRQQRIAALKRELRELEGPRAEAHTLACERAKALWNTPGSKTFPADVPCTCGGADE